MSADLVAGNRQHSMSTSVPQFSIIVAVYNDWEPIERCLRSLSQQANAPPFEAIIVDDGSNYEAPASLAAWNERFLLRISRQPHAGISVARNRGIQIATGSILVFTDADCELQPDCLAALANGVSRFPQQNCFQLHLAGDRSSLLGRAEELRLMSIQQQTLQPDGCIRYLNTAGFAVRKTLVGQDGQLFDPRARRAEDTLLLADLIRRRELPLFVRDAIVQHRIKLSWPACLVKDIRSAWQEGRTYDMIAAKGVRIRMSDSARMSMMTSMWASAKQESIGRVAWFVLVTRRMVHKIVRLLYNVLRNSTGNSAAQ
jgi:glycosyltransferase involved in cell wall biosynthesis